MTARRCDKCGGWVHPPQPCQPCRTLYERQRGRARGRREEYAGGWRYQSQRLRIEWIALHGYVCPGWSTPEDRGHPAHPATDLVVDHDFGVMCRSCNSSKAATHDRRRASPPPSTD